MPGLLLKTTLGSISPIFAGKPRCSIISIFIKKGYSHQAHLAKLEGTAPNTLQSRFFNYFRTSQKYNFYVYRHIGKADQSSQLVESSCHLKSLIPRSRQPNELSSTDGETLPKLHCFLSSLQQPTLSSKEFLALLPVVDAMCCSELEDMNMREILIILDAWMYIVPHKITGLNFYWQVLHRMKKWILSSDMHLSTEEFILIMFYAGFLKKSQQASELMVISLQYINQHFFDLQNITIEELCILTNAVFKTSTQIKSTKLLSIINSTVECNLSLMSDPALFITLIKALRHAQCYNYQLLEKMATEIIANQNIITNMNFTAKAHLLAFYAGALYSKSDIISILVNSSLKDLESIPRCASNKISAHLSVKPRSKDISRFLWAISYIDYHIQHKYVEYNIVPLLSDMLNQVEYRNNPEEIVDSLLSLWISGFKPDNLVTQAFSKNILTNLRTKNKIRHNSRLALLLTCISVEAKHLVSSEQIRWKDSIVKLKEPNVSKHLKKRPSLQKVYVAIKNLTGTMGFSNVACGFIIPHLHIAGITVDTTSGSFCVEVLDKSVSLHESNQLQGLMQLKLRLLKAMHCPVIVIHDTEVEAFEETSDLYVFLEEEMRRISTTLDT